MIAARNQVRGGPALAPRTIRNPKRDEATYTLGAQAGVSNAVEIKTHCPSGPEHPASHHSTAL